MFRNIKLFTMIVISVFLLSFLYIGCGNEQEEPEKNEPEQEMTKEQPGENEIWIQNNSFKPSKLEVFVNNEVTWINKDTVVHRVVSGLEPAILFDSGEIKPGNSFNFEFTDIGPYTFHCALHPESTGEITVVNEETEEMMDE